MTETAGILHAREPRDLFHLGPQMETVIELGHSIGLMFFDIADDILLSFLTPSFPQISSPSCLMANSLNSVKTNISA